MQIGVVFPQNELAGDAVAVRAFAEGVEALGYTHLLAYDHVLGVDHADREPALAGPYDQTHTFHDPFTLFAHLSACTSVLQFATGVLVLPQRQTALVARQAADIALLSDGRFRLGVGLGWNHVEYAALGQSFGSRAARVEEQIPLLRRLWSEPLVSATGRFDVMERVALVPRPAAPIPIWFGGSVEAAFRRGARLGDGFIFAGSMATAGEQLARVRELLVEEGRVDQPFGTEYVMHTREPGVDDLVRKLQRWRALGGTHASVVTMYHGFGRDVAAHLAFLRELATAVEPGRAS